MRQLPPSSETTQDDSLSRFDWQDYCIFGSVAFLVLLLTYFAIKTW